jgi:hypothetical protein
MYATSGAERRVLMATRIAPARGTPKCPSSIGGMFGTRKATRSPRSMPAAVSAEASRFTRSAISGYVQLRSP